MKNIVYLLFIFISFLAVSQENKLSENAQISIITSGPGEALYEKFGHSAIRVKDKTSNIDLIYNYGIFDFDAPNFYLKFIRGFMNYKLASYKFHYAIRHTKDDERWMREQILNLTTDEKNAFFSYLENNVKPENASYFYDPFFENCATKPRDIIKEILGDKLIFPNEGLNQNLSIRQLMNKEIHWNTWGSLGINLALGNKLDQQSTIESAMYLPDYVFSGLETSKVNVNGTTKPLVKRTKELLKYAEKEIKGETINPLLILCILMCIGLFITYKDFKNNIRTKWFDTFVFLTTGFIGLLIVFLWFFTNHSTAPNNFNFLWALAPNFFIGFIITKKNPPKWISKYILVLLILLCCIPIVWISGIQLFSFCLIPIFILLGIRYWFLQKTLNR